MSYDKGKTIKEYMGGGYAQPMKYQTGGYIPGISRQLFGMGLRRDVATAQQEQIRQAKKLEKQEKRRGLFGKLGSLGGTALAAALAPATGGASLFLAKGLGSALGSFAGEKLAEGTTDTSGVGRQSSTGLLDSGFEELGDIKREASKGMLGRSLATGVQTGLMAGGADYLQAHGTGMMGKGLSKLGIDPNKVMGGAPPVTPELLDASQYTDQIMDYVPSPVFEGLGSTLPSPVSEVLSSVDNVSGELYDIAGGAGITQPVQSFFNEGGKVYGYEDGGVIEMLQNIANKASFGRRNKVEDIEQSDAPMIDMNKVLEMSRMKQSPPRPYVERVMERNRMLTDKYGDDWYKASNVNKPSFQELQDMIPKYAGGGLINMLPFNRRIM